MQEDDEQDEQPQGSALFFDPYESMKSVPVYDGPLPAVLNTDVDQLDVDPPDVGQCDDAGLPLIEDYDF